MDNRVFQFLAGVLGQDGACALKKAAERRPGMEAALAPRTLLSWLQITGRNFEGELPGLENTYLAVRKSESGYSGCLGLPGSETYTFDGASLYHVAATVAALNLGIRALAPEVRDQELVRLGKSIDLLVKAKALARELAKKPEETEEEKDPEDAVEKVEGPGAVHKPTKQLEPLAPQAPTKQPKTPVAPLPALKVTKAESRVSCRLCGQRQFAQDRFTGCICFMSLAKSVRTQTRPDGYLLDFGVDWDLDALEALIEAIHGRSRS